MNDLQNKASRIMFVSFAFTVSLILYSNNVFVNFNLGLGLVLIAIYLLCAIPLYFFVKKNKALIEKWLQ